MTALTFTLKVSLQQRVDCSLLVADNLRDKSLAEIAALELQSGNRKLRADEIFTIEGDDTTRIVFKNASAKLDYIGKGQTSGCTTVEGDVGAYAGMQMKGGCLCISGNTGAYAACELRNGEINIGGNAGDYLGAALPGNKKGMQGGVVIVKGNAGDRVGDHLRRGAILIEGNAGDYLGARMTAGTIGILGTVGVYPGYAMKRGTLLLLQAPAKIPATFNDCGAHTLGFLPLLLKSFRAYKTRFGELADSVKRVRRYAGDLSDAGKGEILVVL
ncbi:MAG: formylmethanofuran dehydrogenase subunit C [Methylococcaceae bacterium]|nr:formylmethanofuran dehydrogenase subunit C [Methylococcaceae bacterium]